MILFAFRTIMMLRTVAITGTLYVTYPNRCVNTVTQTSCDAWSGYSPRDSTKAFGHRFTVFFGDLKSQTLIKVVGFSPPSGHLRSNRKEEDLDGSASR